MEWKFVYRWGTGDMLENKLPLLKQVYRNDMKATARQSLNCIKNKQKIKYGEKRFLIWRTTAAPCNVIRGSGMTCHWIRPNVRHIGILHLVLISTTSPMQSTCHSVPVFEILSKYRTTLCRKKWSHVDFQLSRWRFSAILDFMDLIVGSLKSPYTIVNRDHSSKLLSFWDNRVFCILATDRQTDEQMDSIDALSRSGCRERRLNK